MKKFIPLLIMLTMVIWLPGVKSQLRPVFPKVKQDFKALKTHKTSDNLSDNVGSKYMNPYVSQKSVLDDPSTAVTTYDEQTTGSTSPRIYRYPDGTIGAVCTWSATYTWGDRGTGYNFFNGTAWGSQPTARIETSMRTGWPSYAPFGANGEIVIAHNVLAGQPLIMSTRTNKGTGNWTVNTSLAALGPPTGASVMAWPRMVTNGTNRTTIHIIALTEPTVNGGTLYQGLNGALLYNRSTDAGVTWMGWQLLPGMTSSEYLGFESDNYTWSEPKGDTLCFTVGGMWNDQFIMKSYDNGNSWTKTKIWTCPYDLWTGYPNTDTFYCADGFNAVAIDKYGKAHVTFGLQRAAGNQNGKSYWPFTDGIIYWNEDMPELQQSLIPDSLFNHGNLIGWVQDTNVYHQDPWHLAQYQCSLSSMPVIVTDEYGYVFVVWSSVTMLLDQQGNMLRHLFARASSDGGSTWCDSIVEITAGSQYHAKECVYPSASPTSTDSLHLLFEGDDDAGIYNMGQTNITENDLFFLNPSKQSIITCINVGIGQKKNQPSMVVCQNIPNPFTNNTQINVTLNKPGTLSLAVNSIFGQKILEINKGIVAAGEYQFILNRSQFDPGIYLYTVKYNNESITKKLIVE